MRVKWVIMNKDKISRMFYNFFFYVTQKMYSDQEI